MIRRCRLVHLRGINRIITVAIVALLLVGVGSYGVLRSTTSHGKRVTPTATPLTVAGKYPPATPAATAAVAMPQATPREATPAAEAERFAATPGSKVSRPCKVAAAEQVNTVPDGFAGPGKATVSADNLHLRSGPSTDCPVIATLSSGTQVEIHDGLVKNGDYYWRKVTTPKGDGYTIADSYENVASQNAANAAQPAFVEILMYHHVSEGDDNLYVTPGAFEQQLAWLKENGYVSILPNDLYDALYKGKKLPTKPIMLTIDDGNPSSETFKSLLDKYGFKGVYFLPNYAELTEDQIRALDKDGAVCAHTVSHQFLDQLTYDDQYYQIVNNKQWLEKILGHPVDCFAYPFGAYNDTTDRILTKAGFKIAFNASGGPTSISSDVDPLHIPRKEIDPQFDIDTFAKIVNLGW